MLKKSEYVKLRNYGRKIKSPFKIYADFESILVPADNWKQNPEESYTNIYQKHNACSYGYKLVKCLGNDPAHNFINSIIEESKYCSNVVKKDFNKELVMTKEDNEDFKETVKCWICDNDYIDSDIKVRDHCHITEKYRGSAGRDCKIDLKLNHKIPVACHNLQSYDSNFIRQELGKVNIKINVITNVLEKYMSFSITNKLSFIGSFQSLSSLLYSLVKNLSKDDSKYLSQESDNEILVKAFYHYKYMSDFEKFKEELPSKGFIVR